MFTRDRYRQEVALATGVFVAITILFALVPSLYGKSPLPTQNSRLDHLFGQRETPQDRSARPKSEALPRPISYRLTDSNEPVAGHSSRRQANTEIKKQRQETPQAKSIPPRRDRSLIPDQRIPLPGSYRLTAPKVSESDWIGFSPNKSPRRAVEKRDSMIRQVSAIENEDRNSLYLQTGSRFRRTAGKDRMLSPVLDSGEASRTKWNSKTLVPGNAETSPADVQELPTQFQRNRVEVRATPSLPRVQIQEENGLITLVAKDALLPEVLSLLADQYGLNFVFSSDLQDRVTVSLRGVSLESALTSVLAVAGHAWTQSNGIIHITDLAQQDTLRVAPEFTGKEIRVFHLDYVSAESISQALQGMLSPIGSSYTIASDSKNNLKTTESIVVEDLPGSLRRIEQYVAQVDIAPRQVMIEVHVLEIDHSLTDTRGVNFEDIFNIASSNFRVGVLGSPPSGDGTVFAELSTGSFNAVIQALQSRVHAKTLASPKVLALNGQEARIQVGQQLGFRVVTTTQTSTLEEVRFLNVGVVLAVTPRISRDGRIMLQIKPEVSSGRINPDTGLPEEETSEVETNVMLSHGKGMIIGGLIQETNVDTESKIPGVGNHKLIGGLFRQKKLEKSRKEYVFVLMPRVIDPYQDDISVPLDQESLNARDRLDVARGATRMMNQCLDCNPQPLERVQRHEERFRSQQWQNSYDSNDAGYGRFDGRTARREPSSRPAANRVPLQDRRPPVVQPQSRSGFRR